MDNMDFDIAQKSPEWSCSKVIRLIKEYAERPSLWNPECVDYKNRNKKLQDWMELAAIFNCNKLEVERKMKILNSQYRRERHKAIKLRQAGIPQRISWYAYRSFAFLNKVSRKKLNTTDEPSSIKEEPRDDGQSVTLPSDTNISYYYDHKEDSINTQPPVLPSSNNERNNISSNEVNEVYQIEENQHNESAVTVTENPVSNVLERDEWTVFGELIAHGLRKLPNERNRCIAKYKINTILYEAEILSFKE